MRGPNELRKKKRKRTERTTETKKKWRTRCNLLPIRGRKDCQRRRGAIVDVTCDYFLCELVKVVRLRGNNLSSNMYMNESLKGLGHFVDWAYICLSKPVKKNGFFVRLTLIMEGNEKERRGKEGISLFETIDSLCQRKNQNDAKETGSGMDMMQHRHHCHNTHLHTHTHTHTNPKHSLFSTLSQIIGTVIGSVPGESAGSADKTKER